MKKILVIVMLVLTFGCQRYPSEPDEYPLLGKWKSELVLDTLEDGTTISFYNILDFESNGFFSICDNFPKEKFYFEYGSYELRNDKLLIENYQCSNNKGTYTINFKDNSFELNLIEDHCERNTLISNVYFKYDTTIVQ